MGSSSEADGLDEIDIFELAWLTDKSLLVADSSGEHERYRLFESTAAYALEKLSASRGVARQGRKEQIIACALHLALLSALGGVDPFLEESPNARGEWGFDWRAIRWQV